MCEIKAADKSYWDAFGRISPSMIEYDRSLSEKEIDGFSRINECDGNLNINDSEIPATVSPF